MNPFVNLLQRIRQNPLRYFMAVAVVNESLAIYELYDNARANLQSILAGENAGFWSIWIIWIAAEVGLVAALIVSRKKLFATIYVIDQAIGINMFVLTSIFYRGHPYQLAILNVMLGGSAIAIYLVAGFHKSLLKRPAGN